MYKRKVLASILSVIVALSLVACGGSKNADTDASQSTKATSESTSEPESVDDNGQDENTQNNDTQDKDETATGESEESTQENGDAETGTADTADESNTPEMVIEIAVDAEYANMTASEGFEFTSNGDGTCAIVGIGTCADTVMVIPAEAPNGDKVTLIDVYALYDCEDVETLVFAGLTMEIAGTAFQSSDFEKLVITGCDLIVGESAFAYCEDLTEICISGSNIELDKYALYGVGDDAILQIKKTTGVVGEMAFQSSRLAEVNIENCNIEIGDSAFGYGEDIASINIANCVIELGEYAFYDCGKDADVVINNSTVEANDKAFQSSDMISVEIKNCEAEIGDSCFAYCEALGSIIISESNIELGEYAFYDCSDLLSVSICEESTSEERLIVLENCAFQSCEKLASVSIGCGTIELGRSAFAYCEDLTDVTIAGGVLDVNDSVFYGCNDALVITYAGEKYDSKSIEDVN